MRHPTLFIHFTAETTETLEVKKKKGHLVLLRGKKENIYSANRSRN